MAINLLASTDSRVDYGDVNALDAGISGLSIAFRLKFTAAASGNRYVTKWGNSSGERLFLIQGLNTDEIGYVTRGDDAGLYGEQTDAINFADGQEYGIVCTWSQSSIHIVIDGTDMATSSWIDSNAHSVLNVASANSLQVGHETDEAADGNDGDYSEFAAWITEVPLELAKAISLGHSPFIYRPGLTLYDPMKTAATARDLVGGIVPTVTAGIDALHSRIIMPTGQILQFPPAAAPAGGRIMGSIAGQGGLAGMGGIAGPGGGLAG